MGPKEWKKKKNTYIWYIYRKLGERKGGKVRGAEMIGRWGCGFRLDFSTFFFMLFISFLSHFLWNISYSYLALFLSLSFFILFFFLTFALSDFANSRSVMISSQQQTFVNNFTLNWTLNFHTVYTYISYLIPLVIFRMANDDCVSIQMEWKVEFTLGKLGAIKCITLCFIFYFFFFTNKSSFIVMSINFLIQFAFFLFWI